MRQLLRLAPARALCVALLLTPAACLPAAPGGAAPAASAARLTLRADGLPDGLEALDAAARALARREDAGAILHEVAVWPRIANSGNDDYRRGNEEIARLRDALRRQGAGSPAGGSSCLDYCRESGNQCRAGAYRSTDAATSNAAASACVDSETRCASSCP